MPMAKKIKWNIFFQTLAKNMTGDQVLKSQDDYKEILMML